VVNETLVKASQAKTNKSRKRSANKSAEVAVAEVAVAEVAVAEVAVAEIAVAEIAVAEIAVAEVAVAEVAVAEVAVAEVAVAEVAVAEVAVAEVAPAGTAIVVYEHADVQAHAFKIAGSWQKAVSSIIETGQYLIEAKRDLPHGKFSKLFDKEIGKLPFSQDTGQLLMKIAKNEVLLKAEYTRLLPASWMTLAILSRAPAEQLERWIVDGTVHAELQQVEAIALLNPAVPLPEPSTEAPSEPSDEEVAKTAVTVAVQKLKEIKDKNKSSARRQRNTVAAELKINRINRVVQLLKSIDEKLNDNGETDWNKVIEAAGAAVVGDVIDELGDRLKTYKLASTVH
jgi:hypothetical protein